MIHIRTARSLLPILWPDFIEVDGLILLRSQAACAEQVGLADRSSSQREAFCNHEHVLDHFRHGAMTTDAAGDPMLDPAHPDVQRAREVGRYIAALWAAKLHQDFSQYAFRVYCTAHEDPIVRFHRVRPGELPWLTDVEVAADPSIYLIEVDARAAGAAV